MNEIGFEWAWQFAVALAIGVLVGLERGWQTRHCEEGEREVGLRTMALIGLIGGVAGLLVDLVGGVLIGFIVVALGLLLSAAHIASVRRGDLGLTTEVAAMATLLLAVMAGLGQLAIAASGAVVMVLLLGYKTELHGWLEALNRPELHAAFKLLLISVVLLPLLPNRGFGPWEILNPYVIWWMVVLIATISFVGYFAVRIAGARRGTLFTGLFGGLASSTATTLNLARVHRDGPSQPASSAALPAAGILLACGTMFPRILLIASVIYTPLFWKLLWPVLAMMLVLYASAAVYVWRAGRTDAAEDLLQRNPLELQAALFFGAILALVMLLGRALTEWFGNAGIYVLATASGIADVDAITLSLARMASTEELLVLTAGIGILIACLVNTLVKAGMAWVIGGGALGMRVALPMVAAVIAGPALFAQVWFMPILLD
ncbi:MAG: MgtC/SapB family protein [Chromatiaceae bacterium]|nr:MAG: MgtC/SapB family protein [Chromatiaceae bacterium]